MAQFKTGWGCKESIANESTVGNFVGNGSTPFEILSGTWKISLQTVDGETHKVLECVAAGSAWLDRKFLAINNVEAAYGSWRFLLRHAPSATPTIVAVTSSARGTSAATNGHCIRAYNTEVRLSRYSAGAYTDISTFSYFGASIELVEWHPTRRFDNTWVINGRSAPWGIYPAWSPWAQGNPAIVDANYAVSEGLSITANAGDWVSLGTLRDNNAFTKFLGEFGPSEV
jgi:hypothetical protein